MRSNEATLAVRPDRESSALADRCSTYPAVFDWLVHAGHQGRRGTRHSHDLAHFDWNNDLGRYAIAIGVAAYSGRTKAGKWHPAMADSDSSDHPLASLLLALSGMSD